MKLTIVADNAVDRRRSCVPPVVDPLRRGRRSRLRVTTTEMPRDETSGFGTRRRSRFRDGRRARARSFD